jgi:Zinc finger protein
MALRLPTISEVSDFFVTLPEAAERAEDLETRLEEALTIAEDPATRLGRQLSARSVISTSSSFALQQEEAASRADLQDFKFLDNGFCGDVFAMMGKPLVLKRARQKDDQLWRDYLTGLTVHSEHALIQDLFTPYEPPRIPMPQFCISPDNHKWWTENFAKFPKNYETKERMPILVLERILPLVKSIREDLIDIFSAPKGREEAKMSPGNRDYIARLLLGRRRRSTRYPMFFRPKNFSLHLDQAERIGLDVETYAAEMAIGLAICHWRAHVDANDVDFVLGSAPTMTNFATLSASQIQALPPYTDTHPETRYHNYRKRTTHLWILDFDKCKDMAVSEDGVKQAVKAAEDNNLYYPRPHKKRGYD